MKTLLKRKCDEEEICFVDNINSKLGMLNNSGLYLNERGTRGLVINFYFILAKGRYCICMDTVATKEDFNNPTNVTEIIKPFSSR